jgi:hypothetical protein
MPSRSFLRLLAPLALASLLVACGDDPAGDGDTDEPTTKKDSGIKRRADAGTKKTTDNASADDDDDDDDDVPVKDAGKKDAGAKDAGAAKCTTNADCVADDDDTSGIGCCDIPTKTCFVSQDDMCPAPKPTKPSQPAYN